MDLFLGSQGPSSVSIIPAMLEAGMNGPGLPNLPSASPPTTLPSLSRLGCGLSVLGLKGFPL